MKISNFVGAMAVVTLMALAVTSCSTLREPKGPAYGFRQKGMMSYYSVWTNRGTQTASGERLSTNGQTAAHKTLPFGSMVKVTNLRNGKSEVVRINDRGPYIKGRIIDVTKGVARKLDFINAGVVPVEIEVIN